MKSRSGSLLKNLIDAGEFTADDLARELETTRAEVNSYVAGDVVMPLTRQLSLAVLVIQKSKKFVRSGHTLKSQVAAATSFKGGANAVHNEPPTSWVPQPRRRLT